MQSLHSKKSNKWIMVLFVILVALILNPFKVGDGLRNIIGNFFNPVTSYGASLGSSISTTFQNIGRLTSVEAQRRALQSEVASLKTSIATTDKMAEENQRLRKALNLIPKHKYSLVGADIIGYDLQSVGEWVLINRGRKDGIEVGMNTILDKDILVGHVSEVFDKSARVQLITSKKSILGALEPSSMTKFIVTGDHGLGMIATEIPRDLDLEIGTTLLSIKSERSPNIQDLGIGTIKEVTPTQDNLTQQAALEPLFTPSKLRQVYVITATLLQ